MRADREIVRYLGSAGGMITDDIERGATFWVPLHVFVCGASVLLAALNVLAEARRLVDEARQKTLPVAR